MLASELCATVSPSALVLRECFIFPNPPTSEYADQITHLCLLKNLRVMLTSWNFYKPLELPIYYYTRGRHATLDSRCSWHHHHHHQTLSVTTCKWDFELLSTSAENHRLNPSICPVWDYGPHPGARFRRNNGLIISTSFYLPLVPKLTH